MSQNYSRCWVRPLMLAGLVLGPSTINPSQVLSQPSQGVVSYGDWGPRQIYAFPPTGNEVSVNYWDGSRWLWANHGTPPGGQVKSYAGVITYKDQFQPQRIYSFFRGANDHLNVYYWDGAQWRWADQGAPTGTVGTGSGNNHLPAPITYRDPTGVTRIHVYVVGDNGGLHSNIWDGSQWVWADHGRPPGTLAEGVPAVTTYRAGANQQWIHAFVTGVNGHLYVNYWDGSQYRWADQGKPPGTTVAFWTSPGVVTFREGAEPQRIYAFVKGTNQRLYVNYWDGSQWRWQDQGAPSGTSLYSSRCPFGAIQALTYKDVNQPQRIYAFIAGGGGCHLYVNYWDGWQWHWQDQGTPPGGIVGPLFGAVTFKDTYYDDGVQPRQIYVHVWRNSEHDDDRSNDYRYFVNHWDGYQWRWEETGGSP